MNKPRTTFVCSCCKYKSDRRYNVLRHEMRIHSRKRLRMCCGVFLHSKGDYYAHCEKFHPELRAHTIVSKTKYEITADSGILPPLNRNSDIEEEPHSYNLRIRRRYTEELSSIGKQADDNSNISLKYSLSCSELEIEDIPLITFVRNPKLLSYLKEFLGDKMEENIENCPEETMYQETPNSNFHEPSIENTTSESDERNDSEEQSDSVGSLSPVHLPVKKLILQRFKINTEHQIMLPLRERMGIQTTIVQTSRMNSKYSSKANKENIVSYAFSMEQQLHIKVDSGVTVPLVSQQHRDYLSAIDFERYKIF